MILHFHTLMSSCCTASLLLDMCSLNASCEVTLFVTIRTPSTAPRPVLIHNTPTFVPSHARRTSPVDRRTPDRPPTPPSARVPSRASSVARKARAAPPVI